MSNAVPIPRKSKRLPLEMRVRMRPRSGRVEEVWLSDISEDGCCIAFKGYPVDVGQKILIQPGAIEGLVGTVIWAIDGRAGIAFAQPLYGPVVEHLHRNNRAMAVVG